MSQHSADQAAASTPEPTPQEDPQATQEPAEAAAPTAETAPEVPAAEPTAAEAEAAAPEAPAPEPDATEASAPEPETTEAPAPATTPADDAEAASAPATEAAPADETEAAPAPAEAPQPVPAPKPAAAPKPVPRPGPRPTPRALAKPRPAPSARPSTAGPAAAPAAPAPVVPVPTPDEAAATAAAAKFGRVDADGTVYVREEAGERAVGQFPGVDEQEAMSLYIRRYLDLHAKVSLFEARLASTELSIGEIDQTLTKLTQESEAPSAVGDLDGLRARVSALADKAGLRRQELEAERAAAKAAAVAARTAIVEAAEAIAATDPARIQWRPAGDQLRDLLTEWKDAQRTGPRIDRPTEDALWKRFSHARTTFDRERRHFFAELEQRNSQAKAAKEALVVEAEALSSSNEWGATAAAYRDLMARWKAAGRANRKDDDALWARFRAAQDAFFGARDAQNAATDAEYAQNLVVKEQILSQAEALVPVQDLGKTKAALRDLQDRWEAAGKVPRGDLQRVEARMRAVENAVRDAEDSAWKRSNPETRARAEGAAAQLESSIAQTEKELAEAQAKGDKRAIAELESALTAKRSWLEQIVKAARDS